MSKDQKDQKKKGKGDGAMCMSMEGKILISLQRCLKKMAYSVGWMIEGHFVEALKRSNTIVMPTHAE